MYNENVYKVYVIYNEKVQKFYIGQTKDLCERLRMHNEKILKSYTSRFEGTWKVIHVENFPSRRDALIREKQLKSYQGRQFIKTIIPR